nr:hypothetical protein [Tanacetum cinerariifolium]
MNYLRSTVKRGEFSQEEDLSDKYNNQMVNKHQRRNKVKGNTIQIAVGVTVAKE